MSMSYSPFRSRQGDSELCMQLDGSMKSRVIPTEHLKLKVCVGSYR